MSDARSDENYWVFPVLRESAVRGVGVNRDAAVLKLRLGELVQRLVVSS